MRLWPASNFLPFTPYPYEGQSISCPCCNSRSKRIFKLDRNYKYLNTDICKSCGIFFTNPMPTDAELVSYYKANYRKTYMGAIDSVPEKHVSKKQRDADRRAGIVINILADKPGAKTLDIGCGLGLLVMALLKGGYDAYGIEPGELWQKFTQNDRIISGDINTVKFPMNSIDFVSIIHVLEHMRSPKKTLNQINNLLKDDGLIWLEVPDMQSYRSKNHKKFHFAHVLGFSEENLLYLAWQCGFFPIQKITKEQINKRRSQLSFIFRKSRSTDVMEFDLSSTVKKNCIEYMNNNFFNQLCEEEK